MPPALSSSEKLIGRRLRQFRRQSDFPQHEFAARAGCTRPALAAYEAGRLALPWAVAWRLAVVLRLNLAWLYSGEGEPLGSFNRAALDKEFPPKIRFSAAWPKASEEMGQRSPMDSLRGYLATAAEALEAAAETTRGLPAAERMHKVAARMRATAAEMLQKLTASATGEAQADSYGPTGAIGALRSSLDTIPTSDDNRPVQITVNNWVALRERLRGLLTNDRTRASLARDIGASPSRVSEWLSGKVNPNADKTILLLRWVQEQETTK